MLFIPDTTGLDLREQERYWLHVREGREQYYHGIAIHPRHLSFFERYVLHRNCHYNPVLDLKAKIDELRSKYEASVASEKVDSDEDDSESVSSNVARYFELEKHHRGSSEETRRVILEKTEEKI